MKEDILFLNEAELLVPGYLVENLSLNVRRKQEDGYVVSVDTLQAILDYFAHVNTALRVWLTDFCYIDIAIRDNILCMSRELQYTVDWLSWPKQKRRPWMAYWSPFIKARVDILNRRISLRKWKKVSKYNVLKKGLKAHTPDRVAAKIILFAPDVAREVVKQLRK